MRRGDVVDLVNGLVLAQRDHISRARIADVNPLEIIRGILRGNAHATTRKFLGHDGVAHEHRGNEIARCATAKERQESERLKSGLKREHD